MPLRKFSVVLSLGLSPFTKRQRLLVFFTFILTSQNDVLLSRSYALILRIHKHCKPVKLLTVPKPETSFKRLAGIVDKLF